MNTASLFQLFLDPSPSPAVLQRRIKELIDAAGAVLQAGLLRPDTSVAAKLAGIGEVLNFQVSKLIDNGCHTKECSITRGILQDTKYVLNKESSWSRS